MKTTTEVFLSRNFVEFGPFTAEEVTGFAARGLFMAGDYLCGGAAAEWLPYQDWLTVQNAPPAPAAPAKAPARKKAAAKKPAA